MTISASDIPLMSPFAVSDDPGSKFTTAEFDYASAKARERLDRENPGLSAEEYDHAHALLICHMHAVKLGSTGVKSESIGSYSYSQDPGVTAYLIEYRELLASVGGSSFPENVDRTDAEMLEFHLDQGRMAEPSPRGGWG